MTLVDTETAGLAADVTARHVRRLVQGGALTNYGTARRVLVDLDEVLAVVGDPNHIVA